MNRIEQIIEKWVQEYTVPFNTCPDRQRLYAYTKDDHFRKIRNNDEKEIERAFNELTKCAFLKYNDKRLILLHDPKHKYDFTTLDAKWYYNFDELIDRLLCLEWRERELQYYTTEEYIVISVKAAQEVLDYFNIDYNFIKHAEEWHFKLEDDNKDLYHFTGDGWDTNAEGEYKESELFELLDNKLREYFEYEFVPYKTYNPDFNQYKECDHITDFNEMIDALTFDQILEVITGDYWDGRDLSLAKERHLDIKKLESLRSLDKEMLKNTLPLILGKNCDRTFCYGARTLYNI